MLFNLVGGGLHPINEMEISTFKELNRKVVEAGFASEIEWQEQVTMCSDASEFASQAVWVIISSGMKNQIARIISNRIFEALQDGKPLGSVFKHKGKVEAIEYIFSHSQELFKGYINAGDKLTYLETLPFIGGITKYHLAKNLGDDVVKPDRHLVRIAEQYGTTPEKLCWDIAVKTDCRIGTVDIIIWRAANLGFI